MNQLKDVRERILSVLHGGEILFIVPPFTTNTPAIGPHILQVIAQDQGYQADILYVTLLLSSIIGLDFSERLGTSQVLRYWSMLTERLFARSAYGLPPLGSSPEWCIDEAMSISGNLHHHRKMDFDTQELDFNSFWEFEKICTSFVLEVVRAIASLSYKIVGCTTRIGQTNCSVALINGIKRMRPDVTAIIGGANCQGSMAKGIVSLSQAIDYVFSGESEESFRDFLSNYGKHQLPLQRILVGNPLKEIETQPLVSYENYFEQLNIFLGPDAPTQRIVWYETSRGCWWGQNKKCAFCGRDNKTISFRQKSPQKVLKDLAAMKTQYPYTAVAMTDNIMPRSYYKELLPILATSDQHPPVSMYYARANMKLRELVHVKQAKVGRLIPGIEALSTGLLKLLNKGITAKDNLQLLRYGRAVGIDLHWFMLWGIPRDKLTYYEEILTILPLIRHLQPPAAFFCVHLERNSTYVEHPENYQIANLRPWEVYTMIYPEWADIANLASFFVGDYPCESLDHPEIIQKIADDVVQWRNVWERSALVMVPVAGHYMVYDRRGAEQSHNYILEPSQAQGIMQCKTYTDSEYQQWAVEHKLGVVVDSWYVPLVTAAPELLGQFEEG